MKVPVVIVPDSSLGQVTPDLQVEQTAQSITFHLPPDAETGKTVQETQWRQVHADSPFQTRADVESFLRLFPPGGPNPAAGANAYRRGRSER